jgi:Mn2+/Fe2+ NRAMP family transporter
MQVYQQAAVVEKNVRVEDYYLSRIDTIAGCITVTIVAAFILIVCSTNLYAHGIRIETAADAARSLAPIAGRYASWLFAFGLLNASVFAASILPLSTSYTICESFGWESGVDKTWEEAKQFYVLYTALIALGAAIVLLPQISLLGIMYVSQVVNGILLPVILAFMLILINDKKVMDRHVNSSFFNVIAIGLSAVLTLLLLFSVALLILRR